jgi:predicted DNA-binding transcriptional regulator YafY
VVGEAGDDDQKDAARTLSQKIDAVLPEDRSARGARFGFATHAFAEASRGFRHIPAIRAAIRARQKLRLLIPGDPHPRRVLRPLRLDYWGRVWTVTGWDETTGTFVLLRVDLLEEVAVLPQLFVDEPGRTLADYYATRG